MANLTTSEALDDIRRLAIACLMTHLIALEAQFCRAIRRFVALIATQNASLLLPFIWALSGHMTELFAPNALDGRIELHEVPIDLFLHLVKLFALFLVFSWTATRVHDWNIASFLRLFCIISFLVYVL